MKNDTPSGPGIEFLREHPDVLIELLREQNKTIHSLKDTIEKQTELIGQLGRELARLREQLEAAGRDAHRQAAPSRVDERRRKNEPGKPGRPAGHPGHSRKKPDHIDQTIDVPLERCLRCGGPIHSVETIEQFIEELPPIRPTVYQVRNSRGRDVVYDMLGENFGGVLVSDCLATYDDATAVQHKCYSHHLKAIAKAIEARGAAAGLAARRCGRGGGGQPPAQAAGSFVHVPRLRRGRRDQQFGRAPIAAGRDRRKLSAGNKTERGARTWEILASLAATYAQRRSSFFDLLVKTAMLNHSPTR